jgi:drug/metabolite transporter (DMT)-like permease
MSGQSLDRRPVVALTLAAACWGIGTVISKRAVAEIPPLVLLAVQLSASLAVLGVLMRRRGISLRGGAPPLLGRLGILNPGVAYALSLIGLVSISASLSVLLWALEPILILLLAALVLGERAGLGLVVLSAFAVAGTALIVFEPATSGQWQGIAITIAGVGCCAIYTVVTRRWIAVSDSTAQVVTAQQAYALGFVIVVLIGTAVVGGGIELVSVSPVAWAGALGSGVLYYAAAYWFYLTALRVVPASFAAVSFYLIPVFGVAGAFVVLGERLEPRQWLGAAIVLLAVVAVSRLPTRDLATAAARPVTAPERP